MAEATSLSSVPNPRRSVTLPLRLSESSESRPGFSSPDPGVETLCAYSSARIVSFTTSSSSVPKPEEEAGRLPWTSRSERVLAVGGQIQSVDVLGLLKLTCISRLGPLRIYRAPGSVAFLNCGSVLKPIFPKTKCWCVDDASCKFVMQIRKPEYWRIEIPRSDSDDLRTPNELKEVLSQISTLQTDFILDVPETPSTPVKKKPWKPVKTPSNKTERTQSPDVSPGVSSDTSSVDNEVAANDIPACTAGSDRDTTDDTNATPRNMHPQSVVQPILVKECVKTPDGLHTARSKLVPPQLSLITSPPSKIVEDSSPLRRSVSRDSASSDVSSSGQSFHTVQSWHSPITPLPPSPPESPASPTMYPYPHDNITLPKRNRHNRGVSELTVTASTPRLWDMDEVLGTDPAVGEGEEYTTPPPPSTPTLIDDIEDNLDEEHFEVATPPTVTRRIRHRATTGSNSRRALSPLPPAANIFSPQRKARRLQTARHIPTAIIQKTCEILLSPPSHLLHLMLDIAAKIRAGEWRGVVFGFGEGGERIVSDWDYEREVVSENWREDDYGVPLSTGGKKATTGSQSFGGSWEID